MPDYDAIVIGSGPAGAAAAITLARQGATVLLADRADFPRPKLCGGLLTEKTLAVLTGLLGASEADLRATGVIGRSAGRYLVLDRLAGRLGGGPVRPPFRFVDRLAFDAVLRRRAAEAGAELLVDRAVWCDPAAGLVRFASGRQARGRVIVGADGVNSVVRRAVPHAKARWRRGLAGAIEISLGPDQVPGAPATPLDFPVLYGGFVKSGYGWLFPAATGERLIVGLCADPAPDLDLRRSFIDFLGHLGVPDPARLPLKGHPLPYGNFLRRPVAGRALLVGDAAGFADPLLGEGIFYALASGRLAGRAALAGGFEPARVASTYLRALEPDILHELRWAGLFRSAVFACLNRNLHGPVKALFALADGPLLDMVHGRRSFQGLLPRLPGGLAR